jgi:hypothetical protein
VGDMLRDASAWLESKRHEFLTTNVTYVRGGVSVALKATIGRTEFEQRDEYGVIERTEARDYLVRAQDLVLGDVETLPERGDEIIEAGDGKLFIYEVMAPGKEPHYQYSDAYRQTLRIHTRFVGSGEA